MSRITLNPDPRMTRYLAAETAVFAAEPVIAVDVGARWGFNSEWKAFGDHLLVYCFEPDEQECTRLNAGAPSGVTYLPHALGRSPGVATFYENSVGASSGIYKTNMNYFSRLLNRDNGVVVAERNVDVTTLADALERFKVPYVDFIKLDIEGAELDVLRGAGRYLDTGGLCGVLAEVRFQPEINGCPVFSEVDQFLRGQGFRIYDLQFHHQSRHVLPYPGLSDYRNENDERIFAYTDRGQIQDGDALYFRDLLLPANEAHRRAATPEKLLKAAAFLEIYSMNDCAAELLVAHRDRLKAVVNCDRLLDLLTPQVPGATFSYAEYLQSYFDPRGGIFVSNASPSLIARAPELAGELDRVYSSTSWRLTAPLRKLAALVRRFLA